MTMTSATAAPITPGSPELASPSTAGELLPLPEPLADLARRFLEARAAEREAKARASALEAELLPRLEATGRNALNVPGAGRIALVGASSGSRLDARAAEALLLQRGIALPMVPTTTRPSLRVTLNT